MINCANPQAQFNSYKVEIETAVSKVLNSGSYILGDEVKNFQCEFAEYIGVEHVVGVANGTDAIALSLRALGVGRGDEVITVSHTAVATIAAIESIGAIPVLVDIEERLYTLNPNLLHEVFGPKTRAIIAVHLYGQSADLEEISKFCKEKGIFLIEDCAQAHGAFFGANRLGSIGDLSCFSFYPTKNLGAIGDAGAVATNNSELAKRLLMLREYGWQERYISTCAGHNSRLDEIQACILRIKLKYLDRDNDRRRSIASIYDDALEGVVQIPQRRVGVNHVFHLYVIESSERDSLISYLNKCKIFPGIHYPIPVHKQTAYSKKLKITNMKVTEKIAKSIVSLPMYPELDHEKVNYICSSITSFFK